ncbi:MAG: hypothetical protein J5993_01625 [Clostridia bacterium]|nr:hypothetical protein [Clostridia bacterium]
MSFFSDFRSDKCPGTITGNALAGLGEKVCIQVDKVFDACIRQIQLENYVVCLSEREHNHECEHDCECNRTDKPDKPKPVCPLTFVSARSTSSEGVVTGVAVDRVPDKCGLSRVQANVGIPLEIIYIDACGTECKSDVSINVAEDVLLFVPAPSIMPYEVKAVVSAVSPEGTYNAATHSFSIRACITVILKITMKVELLVPSYGYCAIPPAQEYSHEVCTGFFELPLYPQGRACSGQ